MGMTDRVAADPGEPPSTRPIRTSSGRLREVMKPHDKVGASRSVVGDGRWDWPLHGLRQPPEGDVTGWYVWTGEFQDDPEFFVPWHADHLIARCPDVHDLLHLPPGSRFVYAPDYLDIWEDPSLLDT